MTDARRPFSNPLALAVLALLYERPLHPYEMATTMRERGKEHSIRVNYGSLYTVIEQLVRAKFIAVRETLREGKRPEKTIYELTPSGETELLDWMRELVSSPAKEYPQFEAALSLLPTLPPEEVVALLEIRVGLLQKTLDGIKENERACRQIQLPRLFSLENEYYEVLTRAEFGYCKKLLAEIRRDAGGIRSLWTKIRHELLAAKKGGARKTDKEFLASLQHKKGEKK